MDYFKKSLKQVGAMVQNVSAAVAQSTAQGSSFLFKRPPEEELCERFKAVCLIIDQLAATENANGAELERAFNDSKVRDHIKEMLRLLQADDARWVRSHSVSSDEDVVYPCLDSFLDKHMMRELCARAMKDYPRGTMAVVLATAASLMRYIRYPLLPHQSVHTPLAQLITHAMRISNSSLVSGNSEAFFKYKHKIDYNLVALVSTLWRKISENPNLLEFFLFVDRRRSVSSLESPGGEAIRKVRSQLDAIGCLIPLMGKASVGAYAKQAILTAVAMKDARIEAFVVVDTNLLDNVVTELCRRYQRVLDALTSRDRLTLQTRGSGATPGAAAVPLVRANPLAASAGAKQPGLGPGAGRDGPKDAPGDAAQEAEPSADDGQSVAAALEAFLRVLRFCSALRDSSIAAPVPVSVADGASADVSIGGVNQSIRVEIEMLFKDIFLGECVRTVMLPSCSEQQVLSVQLLIRQVIQSLAACHVRYGGRSVMKVGGSALRGASTVGSPLPSPQVFSTPQRPAGPSRAGLLETIALNEATANFFMDNSEFMSILVSRAGAMSKAVVISTLQLISNLLHAASFNSAVRCLLAAPWARSSSDSMQPFLASAEGEKDHDTDSMLRALIERPIAVSGEAGFNVCLGFRYSVVPSAYVDAALKRLMSRIFSFSNLEEFFDISDSPEQSPVQSPGAVGQDAADVPAADMDGADAARGGSSLLTVIFRKLTSFLTLKFDEQIALTGIVSQISCLVATLLTVSSHEAESVILPRFELMWHLNQIIEKLYTDIQGHLEGQIPNHAVLVEFVQNQLRNGEGFNAPSNGNVSRDAAKRPKELENPRVYRAVETAVLVEELMFESRSYGIAAFALRSQSTQPSNSPRHSRTPSKTPGFGSPLTPQMSPTYFLSPPAGNQGFELSNDIEMEEDLRDGHLDSELNTSCLSQLDSLLKEMETDVQELELEYSKLGTFNSEEDLLNLDTMNLLSVNNDDSPAEFSSF